MNSSYNPVTWFEIPVQDIQRARRFYEQVFQWKMELSDSPDMRMALFPAAEGSPNASGALMQAESYFPSHRGTMVYFWAEDIEQTLQRVQENGGKVLNPKKSIGEHGFVGHFEDSEGNRVALHSTR